MLNFHNNLDRLVGLFLIVCSLAVIFFPPGFGNIFYGFSTKWTMKNEAAWAAGQKLFAISTFGIGVIFSVIGSLKIREQIPPFVMVLLLIGLWNLSKHLVHKNLSHKYPNL